MHFFDRISLGSLDRREMRLILMACVTIIVLASGLALFMYPVVFSSTVPFNRSLATAFFGFCILSVLLAGYMVDRQKTIQDLRHQIAEDRMRSSHALKQASADLLQALPNLNSFHDRLPMEHRRAVSAGCELSVLVVSIQLHPALTESIEAESALGDAAKAIYRKLREQDSVYVLDAGYFGIILPEVSVSIAQTICTRLSEGLTDAAGAALRFTFQIDAFSYPDQMSSAYDLEWAVSGLLPDSKPGSKSLIGKSAQSAALRGR